MPFVYPAQYLQSADEFIAHWTQVNAALAPNPLVLRGGYTLATFQADRAALAAAITAVQNADNVLQNGSSDRDIKRATLKERLRQFRATAQGLLGGASNVNTLPKLPSTNATSGKYIEVFDDMAGGWATINAAPPLGFTAPLKLAGGYLQATFATDLATLKTAFTAVTNAEREATLRRQQRDDIADPMRVRLKEYRQAVAGAFPATHALIGSLPSLSAPSGPAPAAVGLTAVWDTTTNKAKLTWTPSNSTVANYVVRFCPPPRYKIADEQAVTSLGATTTTFSTDTGLAAPGSVAFFRVYVVTTQGGERGSNAVKVVRV